MKTLALLFSLFCSFYALQSPFQVYWNVPSSYCKDVRPDDYSIVTNRNLSFNGDKLVIFYSFGALPYCNEKQLTGLNTEDSECENAVNGGVPQAANLTLHYEQIAIDIGQVIPNETFDGLAIIDYEAWRPIFELNHSSRKVYQKYSMQLVAGRCPNCTASQIKELAIQEFEIAARKFFLATLQFAKKLRPNARWGFWEYPLCNDDAGYNFQLECSPLLRTANKQLKWLYEASDILLPKIYLYNVESEAPHRRYYIFAKIHEAFFVREYHNLSLPIYAYAKIEYDVLWNDTTKALTDLFYTKADTCNTLKYPMELGIDGVIIWSTSLKMAYRCNLLHTYMTQLLGPAADIVVNEAQKCSATKCQGKGRCVAIDQAPFNRCQLGLQPETRCVYF